MKAEATSNNTPTADHNEPVVGRYFSPFKNGDCRVLKLVKEDEEYYYFHDLTMYPKDLSWGWFRREKPADVLESNEPFAFPYESYSLWSRQLAKAFSVNELKKVVSECEALEGKYAKQHFAAIQATTSMQSQSQRRAQAGNNVDANSQKKKAYIHAIEIHQHYPENASCHEHR